MLQCHHTTWYAIRYLLRLHGTYSPLWRLGYNVVDFLESSLIASADMLGSRARKGLFLLCSRLWLGDPCRRSRLVLESDRSVLSLWGNVPHQSQKRRSSFLGSAPFFRRRVTHHTSDYLRLLHSSVREILI